MVLIDCLKENTEFGTYGNWICQSEYNIVHYSYQTQVSWVSVRYKSLIVSAF